MGEPLVPANEKDNYAKMRLQFDTQRKFICLMADGSSYCITKFTTLKGAPWEGTCSDEKLESSAAPKDVSAQCKSHLESFDDLGCCFHSICKMIGTMDPVTKAWCGGNEAAADTAMNKLLVKNGLKEMSKECARNAYLTKGNIEFQLAANEIKQLLASIVKDVQVSMLSSEVTVTVQSTRRRLNGAATTSVEYSAGYANKQEASKFGSNSQVKLDTTQKVAAKKG